MSVKRLRSIHQFQYYVLYSIPQKRRVASTIDLMQGQQLLDFVSKLQRKLCKTPTFSAPIALLVVSRKSTDPPQPQSGCSSPLGSQHPPHSRPPPTCTCCGRSGHSNVRCYQRKKQSAKDASKHPPPFASGSGSSDPKTISDCSAPNKPTRPSSVHGKFSSAFHCTQILSHTRAR